MDVGNDDLSARIIVMSVGNNGVAIRSVLMSARNSYTCVYQKFSLEAEGQHSSHRSDRTHVRDMKNSVKPQPPGSDHLVVVLCVIRLGDRILFTLLDDVPLELVRSPMIESLVNHTVYALWFNLHRQFLNRLEGGLSGLIPSSFACPPVKDFADDSASQP